MNQEKYVIELTFAEIEMLKYYIRDMHHDEYAAHELGVFLDEKIMDAVTEANLARARELNEEARVLLEQTIDR